MKSKTAYRDKALNTHSAQGQTIGSFKAMKGKLGTPQRMRAAAKKMPMVGGSANPSRWPSGGRCP